VCARKDRKPNKKAVLALSLRRVGFLNFFSRFWFFASFPDAKTAERANTARHQTSWHTQELTVIGLIVV
jgi:hypothetical protein